MEPPIWQPSVNFLLQFWICFSLSDTRCGCGRSPPSPAFEPRPRSADSEALRQAAKARKRAENPAEIRDGKQVSIFSIDWHVFDRDVFCGLSWRRRKTLTGSGPVAVSSANFAFCGVRHGDFCAGIKGRRGHDLAAFSIRPGMACLCGAFVRRDGAWILSDMACRCRISARDCGELATLSLDVRISPQIRVSFYSPIRRAAGAGGCRPGKPLESMLKSFRAQRAIRLTRLPGWRNFGPSQGKGGGWRGSGRRGPQIREDDDGVRVGHMAPEHRVETGRDPARPRNRGDRA